MLLLTNNRGPLVSDYLASNIIFLTETLVFFMAKQCAFRSVIVR